MLGLRGLTVVALLALGPALARAQDAAPVSSARVYLEGVLARERLGLAFRETPLQDVVRVVQERAWVNVVLDPAVDRGLLVTHQDDAPLGAVLDAILGPRELERTITCDVLWIGKRGAPAPVERHDPIPAALPAFTVHHALAPFRDVLRSLGDLARVRFELSAAAEKRVAEATVTMRVRNLPLHHLVTLLAATVGLTWTRREGAVWLHAPDEDPAGLVLPGAPPDLAALVVTISYDKAPLGDVLGMLHGLTGVTLAMGAGVDPATPVTLRASSLPLPAILDQIGDAAGLVWRRTGDGVVLEPRQRQ